MRFMLKMPVSYLNNNSLGIMCCMYVQGKSHCYMLSWWFVCGLTEGLVHVSIS